ncbi:MAG TPA: phosphodiester glycosidase family protein [Armatimonadota bacterium]|nr:phosphodiester glycosidase family protein [Armatimonadota bacterium]HPP75594.1 phosphodiester glycosidase family protein [Armatimonadota bacterium]
MNDQNHKLLFCLCFTFLFGMFAAPVFSHPSSIAYQKRWAGGLPVHVVTVNLNDRDVRLSPMIPRYGIGHSETWSTMIARARPTAAITGTFFDTRSLYPTGDIVIDNNMVCRGVVGTAISISPDNRVTFIPTKRGRICDWSAYQHVLVGGPVIVWDGKVSVYPKAQGFTDPQLFAKRPRTAVGITKHGKLLMVAVTRSVYLSQIARSMKDLGAIKAVALDGGSSSALYYRGRSFVKPGRRLTNLLVAYDSESRHQEVKHLLAPSANRITQAPKSSTAQQVQN